MNKDWISIEDKKPISGQDVLVYWYEEDLHQVHILTYFEKGDNFGIEDIDDIDANLGKADKLLAGIFSKGRKVEETGFYMFKPNERGYCKFQLHADIITHWMQLPMPPNNKSGDLGNIEI